MGSNITFDIGIVGLDLIVIIVIFLFCWSRLYTIIIFVFLLLWTVGFMEFLN